MDRIQKLKDFMAANPDDSFVQHALALEYIKLGNDDAAAGIFKNLLARDENYVGSYYHLAKLIERKGNKEEAMAWYEKGMTKAKEANNMHAYNELRAAYEDLET